MTKESFFSKISWSVVRFVSQPHDISRILFAAVMLIAFTAIDVYAFDVKKTENLPVTIGGKGCTFESNVYEATLGYDNLLNVTLPSADLSNYDKLYVTTSKFNMTGVSYRVIINIKDDTNNYIATCSTEGKQGLSLTSDFKNGLATLTKDKLKNVTQLRIGGELYKDGFSFTLSDIHLSKTYVPDRDGKITLSPSDFTPIRVTIDAYGNITAAESWGDLVIDFDDNPYVTKIESITVNTTSFTPYTFFVFNDAPVNDNTAQGLDNAKGDKFKDYTLSRFGLGVGGEHGFSNKNYQLNSVIFKYDPYTKIINEDFPVTFNNVTNTRKYTMYIPASAKNKTKVPVVFSLHGRYNSMNDGRPDFNELADANGFIVVYPQGRNGSSDNGTGNWNDGFKETTGWEATGKQNDDTEFLKQLANKIKADCDTQEDWNGNLTVDPTKFYLCGFSMGGMMTYAMANAVPDIFAAYASTGGYPINEFHLNVTDINRSPFLHIHGKSDGLVPYIKELPDAPDGSKQYMYMLEKIKQNMVARYGYKWTPTYTRDATYNCDIYDFTSNTSSVGALRYIEIDGLGHNIHGNASNFMYDFFKLYSYTDHSDVKMEWSWDMTENTKGGWQYGNTDINFGNHSNTGSDKTGNHNVYPCIQLPAGKHVIYAKYSMAKGEDNAYLTLKNNNTGTEIVARKLVNNSGSADKVDMTIAYGFVTDADAEYSVYVGRANGSTLCTDLAIYKAPYTAATDQSVDNTTVDITTGKVLEITFEELKSSVKTDGIMPTLLASKDNGVAKGQPNSGYDYYYANRLERKNGDHHYDVIHHDAVFGNYFQNMPHADIYERTGEEDFMRIMFPAGTLKTVKDNGAITIGFWVNAKLAVDLGLAYRDPSIFYLAGGSYEKANSEKNPHMFNIHGAGGISGYMSETVNYQGGSATFGEFSPNSDNNVPRGEFYKNNFYLDGNWHYLTFQMYNDFSRYNMYVDGFPATLGGYTPTSNTSKLKEGIDGLKSIVLGGLNARNVEFAYDVAFAYDDIVIYNRVLSHAAIKKIITDKKYTPSWIFYRTLKNKVMLDADRLSSTLWTDGGNGVYTYNQANTASVALTYDGVEQIPAFRGLQFKNSSGQIKIDTNTGKLILSNGVTISFPGLPAGNTLRFETEDDHQENNHLKFNTGEADNYFWPGNLPDINGHKRTRFTLKEEATGTPQLTLTADAHIFGIERTEKEYIQLNFVEPGKEAEKLYDSKDIVTTPRTYGVNATPNDILKATPTLRVVKNGVNAGNGGYTFKYSSSAPHIASVDIDEGYITLHGVQGSAIITAELVDSERKYDTTHGYEALYEPSDRIFATYEIITTRKNGMYVVNTSNTYTLNKPLTLPGKADDIVCKDDAITVTLGGWKFNSGTYQEQTDSYSNVVALPDVKCYGFTDLYTDREKFTGLFPSGSSLSTNGEYEAKSEAWNKTDATTGFFTSNPENSVTDNVTPWTLPCRGSHIKVEPIKPGIVSVYVKQEGCVSRDGQDKPQSINLNTVFITDETGKSVRDIVCDTKTRVADQIWKDDGRARAEYYWGYKNNENLYSITDAICQSFEDPDKSFDFFQKWSFLDNWENPGMTGHVFCVNHYNQDKGIGLDGHVVISTGIVRYTFNVVPGKSYYIFSNNSALGLAGFTFDEGKHMNLVEVQGKKNAYLIANNKTPVVDVYMDPAITLADDEGDSFSGVTVSSETEVPRYDEYTHNSLGNSGLMAYKPGTRAKVTLERTFKDKQWAGICLPYTISNRQLKAAFGADTKLVLLHHIDNNNVVFINHTNEDLIAGYPYLIFPNGTVTESDYSTVESGTDGKKTIIKDIVTYATFEQAQPKFSVMDQQKTNETPNTVAGTTFDPGHHYFIGLFKKGSLGEGSYYISNSTGKLTRIGKTTEAKPYRSYIMWQPGTTSAKAPMLSTMLVEDSEGNDGGTTSIDDILFEQGIMTQAEDVYTVSGMKLGRMSDMQHLQRGIYIVNGKKFVKK